MPFELIRSLHVENFRGFKTFDLEDIKRVNLIGGMNNAGKTTLLESLLMLCKCGLRMKELAADRNNAWDIPPLSRSSVQEQTVDLMAMWTGFPKPGDAPPLTVRDQNTSVTIETGNFVEGNAENGEGIVYRRFMTHADQRRTDHANVLNGAPGYRISVAGGGAPRTYCAPMTQPEQLDREDLGSRSYAFYKTGVHAMQDLAKLWNKITLYPASVNIVMDIMRTLEPKLQSISFVDMSDGLRVPYCTTEGGGDPLPFTVMGDGMRCLLSIAIMLCAIPKEAVVLVDEVETGLHYSIQKSLWKTVLQVAEARNLQIFATTHSSDAICALAEAAEEAGKQEDCQFIRLQRKEDKVTAVSIDVEAMLGSPKYNVELR